MIISSSRVLINSSINIVILPETPLISSFCNIESRAKLILINYGGVNLILEYQNNSEQSNNEVIQVCAPLKGELFHSIVLIAPIEMRYL
jgi:hypothetical protein